MRRLMKLYSQLNLQQKRQYNVVHPTKAITVKSLVSIILGSVIDEYEESFQQDDGSHIAC